MGSPYSKLISREASYSNGKLHGRTLIYDERGTVREEMNYKENRLDGKVVSYDAVGKVLKSTTYKDGKRESGMPKAPKR